MGLKLCLGEFVQGSALNFVLAPRGDASILVLGGTDALNRFGLSAWIAATSRDASLVEKHALLRVLDHPLQPFVDVRACHGATGVDGPPMRLNGVQV